ncbi:tetratricopeptide repeat-containing sensor histidine kinase [Flavobacterium sp. 25HG05S-40]|uniref:tetratricopeptide repeat-containing sensor histidine kinase n=1 Tax=Flavobacterium sp. 25HG05S-40 TaxID=3458682 RepID=UPI004044C5A8
MNDVSKTSDSIDFYFANVENPKIVPKEKDVILLKAEAVLKNQPNTLQNRSSLYKLAEKSYELGKSDIAFSVSQTLLNRATEKKDTINIANSSYLLGNYYLDIYKNDSSFYYFVKAEKLYKKIKSLEKIDEIYLNKAFIYIYESDYANCESSASKVLLSINPNDAGSQRMKYDSYNLIAVSSNELKNYTRAIEYHQKALLVAQNFLANNKSNLVANSQNNIGVVYQNINNHTKAIQYFKSALSQKDLSQSPSLFAMLVDNLAYSQFKIGDNKDLPELFYTSLKIREENNLSSGVIANKIHLSEYYSENNDTINSKKFAFEALNLAKSTKISGDILVSLNQLSIVDKAKSSTYSKEYIRINDSLQVEERNSKDKFARIQFETDEIIQEKDVLENRNRTLLYVFVVTFILVALLFVVRAQRARTRELLFKQTQQKANEEIFNLMMSQQSIIDESRNKEKKRLAQDLHDGILGRMFGLRLNLDSLNSSTDSDAVQKRHELLNELKTIEQDIREISHDLNREKMVLINNFVSIVHNLLEEQKTSHEANVVYHIDTKIDWDKIGNAIKINLYRILQEGLQNINKYANAKNIKVDISGNVENVYLKIKDDGIGFDVNKKSKGIGMQNMISRTHDCQGIIDINSKKGQGTKIIITVPLETKQQIVENA